MNGCLYADLSNTACGIRFSPVIAALLEARDATKATLKV
jgi:hypothetical protein